MPQTSLRRLGIALLCCIALAAPAARADDPGEELRAAAGAGDEARVRKLLEAGVAVDAPARYGQTPLFFAAEKGHLGIARLLIERGANVKAGESFFGQSVLDLALQSGNLELVRLLLDKGAEGADAVLFTAIQQDSLELARMAFATGQLEPLDLAAARREAANSSQALRDLLAAATAQPRQRPPYHPTAERLQSSAGRYQTQNGADGVTVTLRGEGLELQFPGKPATVAVAPVEADRFDSADGRLTAQFGGRGGLIEWLQVNQDGELSFFSLTTADPAPLRSAAETVAAAPVQTEAARPWPQFRGPGASGVGDGQGAPASWNVAAGEGVRFKTPIPGIGLASPIVWGDRIYVTTAVSSKGDTTFKTGLYGDTTSVEDRSEHSFRLYALETKSGKVVWEHEVHRGVPGTLRHLKSSLANSTPVTDGERLVVLFGAVGKLAAYDLAGKQLWQRDVGILDSNDPQSGTDEWGHASSPILAGDRVIVQADRRKDSFLAAYRLSDGAEVWRVARDEPSTWATPTLVAGPAGDELVVNGTTIRGYDPRTGAELWHLGPNSEVVVATPQAGDGLIYVTAGYPPVRPVYAIRPGQRGDLTLPKGERSSPAVAWSHNRGGTYIPTPILYRGFFHTCNNNGVLTTYRATTGESLSTLRLNNAGISVSASPVAADGRLYMFSEDGQAYVLASGPEPVLLGSYPMGETVMSTPAISGGLMVVRTLGHVVGLEAATAKPAAGK
jgi:outer membrane protein assembly factor BamB